MRRQILKGALARAGWQVVPFPRGGRVARSHPDFEPEFAPIYASCRAYTMTSPERMYALWQATRHIVRHEIQGDVVECGVWRGGSSMVAALTLLGLGDTDRTLWLYDTFSGMNEPTERDVAIDGLSAAEHWDEIRATPGDLVLAAASLDDVRANMARTRFPGERLRYVEGPVEETIPANIPDRIALLRLDTDWHDSTQHELEHLWDRLEPGGVLIIDDYGHWAGAREAVDEFFAGRADAPLLARVDYTGRLAVKR